MATNHNTVMNKLIDAITASGKKFKEIDTTAIISYLKQSDITNSKDQQLIIKKLEEYYNPSAKVRTDTVISTVDYNSTVHNDVKKRQPRKSVFSEIKKIAG